MFNYVCILQSPNFVITYHFFSDNTLLLTFAKQNIDRVWKIYKLEDVTDYWVYSMKATLEIENQNKSANVE